MNDRPSTPLPTVAGRQICAYLDGSAHYWRYKNLWAEHPGLHARIDIPTILGTLALAPFLQTLSSTLGTNVGERTSQAFRTLARKILRRELTTAPVDEQRATARNVGTSAAAWIQFDEDMPDEALLLLPGINFESLDDLGDHAAVVRWLGDEKWHAVTLRHDRIVDATWDPGEKCWQIEDRPNEWGENRRRAV